MGSSPDGWKHCLVRDVAPKGGLVGGPFGSSLGRKDYVAAGVPVIRGQNLSGRGKFDGSEFVYVSSAKADELSRNIALPGDLVLTQRGTLGQVGIVPTVPFERYVISQSQMRLRPDPSVADAVFLYYLFSSQRMLDLIDARAIVTGVPHINLGILGTLPLELPSVDEQRSIASVLDALDNKIESNRRKCALLDTVLITEYRRVVAEGSAEVQRLGDVVVPGLGGSWGEDGPSPKASVRVACMRGVDLAALAASEVPSPPVRWLSPSQYLPRTPGLGEIWVEGSGSFCGRSFLISPLLQRLFGDPICYSNFVKRLVPVGDPRVSAAAWLALRLAYESGEVGQARIGSAFPNLDVDALLSGVAVHVPSGRELENLSKLAEARLDPATARESRALAVLRDALLPELLSGRLRVREAEKVIEDVV